MKKTYITPTVCKVRTEHQSIMIGSLNVFSESATDNAVLVRGRNWYDDEEE